MDKKKAIICLFIKGICRDKSLKIYKSFYQYNIKIMTRIKLSEKYHNEREEMCKKLIEIVGTEFYLCDFDEDTEKQNTILALKDDIQKIFAVSSISTFKPNLKDIVKRDYLNLVRAILKQQGYIFEGKNCLKKIDDNGLFKKTMKYKIFRS